MANVLPPQTGLTVSNVIYRYTTVKDPSSEMLVSVQNENGLGEGYIFRSTDDWSGLPGNTINRAIPVGAVPLEAWGDGSIAVEGEGTVEDPTVIYTYRYDTCYDPQVSPECVGYIPPVVPYSEVYVDPLEDEYVQAELARKARIEEEEENIERKEKSAKERKKLEQLLGGINGFMMSQNALAQEKALFNMKFIPQSYLSSLSGGEYNDTLQFEHKEIPKNLNALRVGLAQQLKHEEMVRAQYDNILSKRAK